MKETTMSKIKKYEITDGAYYIEIEEIKFSSFMCLSA